MKVFDSVKTSLLRNVPFNDELLTVGEYFHPNIRQLQEYSVILTIGTTVKVSGAEELQEAKAYVIANIKNILYSEIETALLAVELKLYQNDMKAAREAVSKIISSIGSCQGGSE